MCDVLPEPHDELNLINEDVWQQLSDNRNFATAKSEEEKWTLLYRKLFPDDEIVPSPCKSKMGTNSVTRCGQG